MKSISILKRISCTAFIIFFYYGGPPHISIFTPLAIIAGIMFWIPETPKIIKYRSIIYWGMVGYLIHLTSNNDSIHLENLFIQPICLVSGLFFGHLRYTELVSITKEET